MSPRPEKRKAQSETLDRDAKRTKGKKKWGMPRRNGAEHKSIQPGDTGVWATCGMKKEAKSVSDLRDLFEEYATLLYGSKDANEVVQSGGSDSDDADIEVEIRKEIADMRAPAKELLFTSVKLETQCLVFFKTRSPVEPVAFVERICQDAAAGAEQKNCRFVKRLTPITLFDKATTKGLDTVAKEVLAPHFHGSNQPSKKFAIRPSIRNNKEFTRDEVIKTVAAAVGPGHQVDLHEYDLLILVEIYQNVVGMSVVSSSFDKLKRFNLEELRHLQPSGTPLNEPPKSKSAP